MAKLRKAHGIVMAVLVAGVIAGCASSGTYVRQLTPADAASHTGVNTTLVQVLVLRAHRLGHRADGRDLGDHRVVLAYLGDDDAALKASASPTASTSRSTRYRSASRPARRRPVRRDDRRRESRSRRLRTAPALGQHGKGRRRES